MFFSSAMALAILHSSHTSAAMMEVLVGANNGLSFTPSSVQAQPGDQVQFVFLSRVEPSFFIQYYPTDLDRITPSHLAILQQEANPTEI